MKASDLFVKCLEKGVREFWCSWRRERGCDDLCDTTNRFCLVSARASSGICSRCIWAVNGQGGVCLATLGPGATNLVTGLPTLTWIGRLWSRLSVRFNKRLHKETSKYGFGCDDATNLKWASQSFPQIILPKSSERRSKLQ